ncbi:MAG: hypothetical protein M3Y24_01400 [Acidobacteriota bacterium]|nr:hypothetical protein [Acidobacteriota bacterium]
MDQYQHLGASFDVQAINPASGLPCQLSDLDFDPNQAGTPDLAFISAIFHDSGNPSWYLGGQNNAIHLVNITNPDPNSPFKPGLQWHIDAINPTSGLAGFIGHNFGEVLPYANVPNGTPTTLFCSTMLGCQ